MHVHTLILRLSHLGSVFLDAVEELLARAGERDVLDADVDPLFDVAVADSLVDDDADGGFGNVVDNAGFAMVDFVGHAVQRSVLWDLERWIARLYGWEIGNMEGLRIRAGGCGKDPPFLDGSVRFDVDNVSNFVLS